MAPQGFASKFEEMFGFEEDCADDSTSNSISVAEPLPKKSKVLIPATHKPSCSAKLPNDEKFDEQRMNEAIHSF